MNPTTRPTRTPRATHPRQATRTSRTTTPTGAPTTPLTHRQLNLATRHQLTTTAGIPPGTITSRTRPGGPWQRLLPRVYLLQTGPPDRWFAAGMAA
ncbi:hypothetical protein [Streptomyces sp. NBC_00454]|uniref:hypothetical protein n=1 Tax=Streptomyces sp. NBC_00454 TaxID=2975747 RepID=UPI0030E3B0D4